MANPARVDLFDTSGLSTPLSSHEPSDIEALVVSLYHHPTLSWSIHDGLSARLLLGSWLYEAGRLSDSDFERLQAWLVNYANQPVQHMALFDGLAGRMATLKTLLEPEESLDLIAPIVEALKQSLERQVFFDWTLGVAGVLGVACMAPVNLELAQQSVQRLLSMRTEQWAGRSWYRQRQDAPTLFKNDIATLQKTAHTSDVLDTGLAHGIAGVAIALSMALETGLLEAQAPLEQVMDQLIHIPVDSPGFMLEHRDSGRSRIAWCYGPLSVGFSLLSVGQRLNNPSWRQAGAERIDWMVQAIAQQRQQNGLSLDKAPRLDEMIDGALCHGSAGAAHLLVKSSSIAKRPDWIDTANYFYDRLLKDDHHRYAAGPFAMLRFPNRPEQVELVSDTLIEGPLGVAMVLLSAIKEPPYLWDFGLG